MSDTVTVTRDHWQARRAAASLPPQQKVDPAQHGASHCDVTVTAESDRSHHDGYTQRRSGTGTVTVPGGPIRTQDCRGRGRGRHAGPVYRDHSHGDVHPGRARVRVADRVTLAQPPSQ